MAKFYDISDWSEQLWWNTGGTRDKKIYLNPDDENIYFFKQSFNRGQRDYKYEFWSEIIASEIGLYFGFNILPYDIAIRNQIIGCISKSMINQATEELIEGGKYLQAFDSSFNPSNTKARNKYTFRLIVDALVTFGREDIFPEFIEMIVFDALIGNSDRHQENWATINNHSILSKTASEIERDLERERADEIFGWFKKFVLRNRKSIRTAHLMLPKKTRFSPIYDSGCSFGRELSDFQIVKMLEDKNEIEKYINKGKAEIHWEGEKINHFELLNQLCMLPEFKTDVLNTIKRILERFSEVRIEEIVFGIDNELMRVKNLHSLPEQRKRLILELLILRIEKLKELYSDFV